MLEERSVLQSVETLPAAGGINVCWSNQVWKDGKMIAETIKRCSYSAKEKNRFLTEVDGAQNYIAAMGW